MKKVLVFLFLLSLFACRKEQVNRGEYVPKLMEIPKGFDPIEFPEGNEFTKIRWELGKRLFYDNILSSDRTLNCSSCHTPSLAFSDHTSVSLGVEGREGTRNSPSLANVAYHPYFTREGGVPTLEMQVLIPIQEHNEMDFNIVLVAERMKEDSAYITMAQEAYQREPDAYVITRSLATFERSLLSGNSRYDQWKNYRQVDALTADEHAGMELFFSEKTNCFSCHSGFNFTNYSFENNGIYAIYPDSGRYRLTAMVADIGKFKVPSLRNIALTSPYMHDGSIQTLEEVVMHYNSGGQNHANQSNLIRPLNLTETEQNQLVSFLESLTDETFINNPIFNQ